MNTEALKKILENYHDIIGVRVNGTYYEVNCFDTDVLCNSDIEEALEDDNKLAEALEDNCIFDQDILYAFQLDENNCYLEYSFTAQDILNAKSVKLYKLQEV